MAASAAEAPLHPSGDRQGRSAATRSSASDAASLQHEARGAALLRASTPQQVASVEGELLQHEAIAASSPAVTSGVPEASAFLMRVTQAPQVALPGFTRLAAAIQSESGSSIPSGGSTPLRMAHASRSRGVWQQQLVQHCVAVAQPQCPLAHGNASSMEKSSHAATCAELGKTPADAAKNARVSTQTSHRCDRKMREVDNKQSVYRDPMPRQGESSDDGVAQGGPSDIEDLRSPRGE